MACEQHNDLIRRIEKTEIRLDDVELNLEALKLSDTRSSEQIKMIFKILEKLEQTVEKGFKDTKEEIDKIKMRPGRYFDGAITALIAGVMGYIAAKILGGL